MWRQFVTDDLVERFAFVGLLLIASNAEPPILLAQETLITPSTRPLAASSRTALSPNSAGLAERLLLLHNGKVVKGIIRQNSAGYVVTVQGGQLVLPFDQVRLEAADLEDAYRQQRDTLPDHTAAAHIELARWCLSNGLLDPARKELREAIRREPDSTVAKTMLQRINDQLLATNEAPAVTNRNGAFSLLGDAKPGIPPETIGGLPREAAAEYMSKIQPLLVNRCATAGCHGPGSGNSFELLRAKLGKAPPKSYSEKNLSAVMERLDLTRPLNSPLLAKLRGESNAFGVRQSHGGLSPEQVQSLRAWIESISSRPKQLSNAKTQNETAGKERNISPADAPKSEIASSEKDLHDVSDLEELPPAEDLFRSLLRQIREETSPRDEINRSTNDE